MTVKYLALVSIAALTAGCVSNKKDLDEGFGVAYKGNMAAQIVDSTPADGAPEGDGAAVDIATARYKTDNVKQPVSGSFTPGENSAVGGQQQ